MTEATRTVARKRRSASLFVRILLLILATVMAVQIINFAVLLLMPPPTPILFTTSRVAAIVRAGGDPAGLLTLTVEDAPPAPADDPRGRRLGALLAADLGIAATRVVVVAHRSGPPPVMDAFRPAPPRPDRGLRLNDDVLFGSFAASVRRDDGRWITVQGRNPLLDVWRLRFIMWVLVAVLVIAPIAWFLARLVLRPIRLFATAADRLGRDPHAPPLPLSGPPELRDAAREFNEMQARLNRYVEDRTTLIGAVAHDLRTPLMRLALRLEKAPDDLRRAGEADIAEMRERISTAMSFVRDTTRTVERAKLDLRSLAQSVTDEWSDEGGDVTLLPGTPLTLRGDGPALKSLLNNLLGNALRYAGDAQVRLSREGDMAVIEIADNGPGLADADLDRAFEPFFRAEQSRNRDTGGTGLGLASVRAVARSHGGDAMLENRAGGGLLARVRLPL